MLLLPQGVRRVSSERRKIPMWRSREGLQGLCGKNSPNITIITVSPYGPYYDDDYWDCISSLIIITWWWLLSSKSYFQWSNSMTIPTNNDHHLIFLQNSTWYLIFCRTQRSLRQCFASGRTTWTRRCHKTIKI